MELERVREAEVPSERRDSVVAPQSFVMIDEGHQCDQEVRARASPELHAGVTGFVNER